MSRPTGLMGKIGEILEDKRPRDTVAPSREGGNMLNANRKLLASLALLIVGALSVRSARANDADQEVYNLASFHGDYAVVGAGGSNVAALLGTLTADGHGGVSGSALANLPGPTARTLVQITYSGTYSVNPDGTGLMTLTVTLPSGRTAAGTLDLLITESRNTRDQSIAIKISGMQRELVSSLSGGLVVYKFTKRHR